MKKIFDFFIFSSLYISGCAVLMVYQTSQLLLHGKFSFNLAAFVFFSTVCSYNFHWYLTTTGSDTEGHESWTAGHKPLHLLLYFAGLCGSAFYFFRLKEHWPFILLAIFITFLYSAPKLPQKIFLFLRRIAVGKTIFLALVWIYVTTALPVILSGEPWTAACTWFCLSRFLLIYAICIIFDFRDRESDRQQGIRSLITWLGEKGINLLFAFSLGGSCLFTILLYSSGNSMKSILLLLIPALLTGILYKPSKRNFSDYLYYFILDGLMMFSGLLMLILGI